MDTAQAKSAFAALKRSTSLLIGRIHERPRLGRVKRRACAKPRNPSTFNPRHLVACLGRLSWRPLHFALVSVAGICYIPIAGGNHAGFTSGLGARQPKD